jgi:RHS repeat-associated protein
MTSYSAALNGGTISGGLTWNPNGSLQQLAILDPFNSADVQTCSYSADDLSRIASATCLNGSTNVWGQTFSYDPFGNVTKTVPSGDTGVSWMPGYSTSTNRYTLGGTSYDGDGNILNDGSNTYTWDAEGKPVTTVYSSSHETYAFTYDAFGHKVELSVNGSYSSSFVRLGDYKLSATGQTPLYSEYPFPGGSIQSEAGGGTGVQLADWLGTVRAFWGYTGGSYIQSGAHAPFGESYAYNTGNNPKDFTGQENDDSMNNTTYYFPERQFRSSQGRWLSPDPAGLGAVDPTNPQSWNRYAYVVNSPLLLVDPAGMCPQGMQNPTAPTCFIYQSTDPTASGGCATSGGQPLPCGLIGGGEATVNCPNNNCSAFGTYTGTDSNGAPYSFQLTAGVNGATWSNNFNGEEVTPGGVAVEFGLLLPLDSTPINYLSTPSLATTPARPPMATVSAVHPPTRAQADVACKYYAIQANNGFGNVSADSANASIASGTKFEQYTQYERPSEMNPSASNMVVAYVLTAPSIYIQASYQQCMAALGF